LCGYSTAEYPAAVGRGGRVARQPRKHEVLPNPELHPVSCVRCRLTAWLGAATPPQAFDRLMAQQGAADRVRVVLVSPFLDRNVGAVARCMLNFGLRDLCLVAPQCDHLSQDAITLAAGADDILREARITAQASIVH
jgi:hypothetical protein